ncbi:hypothetical protein D3C84_756280 [compost metagenome]
MNPFDLHVEHRRRVDRDPQAFMDQIGQGLLVVQPLLGELLAERGFFGKRLQASQQLLRIIQQLWA